MAIVINLFGAPGAGKSTGAAYIFSQLKLAGINCELITEFAKDLTWEGNRGGLENQLYVTGNQSYRLSRCANKVDVIVTDSPLPLSIFYNHKLSENYDKLVMEIFNSYDNLNIYVDRDKPYNPVGRNQTETESDAIAKEILELLDKESIYYTRIKGNIEEYDEVVSSIIWRINFEKNQDRGPRSN